MASSLPPVKNAAFTFDVALVSQADTDTFKTSPTLAAGDITVSLDGGNFANITTLPTQIQTTGVLPVALTAAEMNADRVTVRFHDAAGDEWQDALVTIYTAGQTLDTTDSIADDVKATVQHTDYGNAKLVRSTTPANTLAVDANHLVAVPSTQKVDVETIKTQAVTAAAPVTVPAGIGTSTHSAADVKTALEADGSKLDHLWEMTEDDGGTRRLTANALEEAPAGGGSAVTVDANGYVKISGSKNTLDDLALSAVVAVSSTEAESVVSGRLGIRSHHSFAQAVTSTSTADLTAVGAKLWLAIKRHPDDTDAGAVVLIEKTAGLTVLAGAAYTTVLHGSLTVTGSAGAWSIAIGLDEVATGLLHGYAASGYYAELKAKVGNDTIPVWDGRAAISKGIVQAVS